MHRLMNVVMACVCGLSGAYTVFAAPTEQVCIEGDPESHDWEGCKCKNCFRGKSEEYENCVVLSQSMLEPNGILLKGDVKIPEKIIVKGKEKTVIGIGQQLFDGNKEVSSVHLPDTVLSIEDYAFNDCENLKSINFPAGLEVIGRAAFQSCLSLQEVNLPDSVKRIEDYAFNHCPAVKGSVFHIPANITRIGHRVDAPTHMFYDFGSEEMAEFQINKNNQYYKTEDGILYSKDGSVLVSIPNGKRFENDTFVMPDSVEKLGELSFGRNRNIKTLVLSDNLNADDELTENQYMSFNNRGNKLNLGIYGYCSVEKYETKLSNPRYKAKDGVLYDKNMYSVVAIPCQYHGAINIPEGVKIWKKDALWCDYIDYFKNISLNHITEINIPASMENIDQAQLDGLNYLYHVYHTRLHVDEANTHFKIENGELKRL